MKNLRKTKSNKKNIIKNKDNVLIKTKTLPEIDGPKGPEPTRYGDWEKNGRCSDF
tara:strand:- start:214 stop:378 length:165 start_codon:yes stop_codon:yes gene_type:complete